MSYLLIIFVFTFGLIIGSFLNCLIWRLHKGESIWPRQLGGRGKGRSYCPKCKKQIAWYDNIPVLSFIVLRGRCRHCGKPISWQYPVVELVTGVLFVVAFIINFSAIGGPAFGWQFLISKLLTSYFLLLTFKGWFLIAVMIVIFIYDLRWYLILDVVTLPACAIVFILNLFLGFSSQGGFPSWQNFLISGIMGSSFFLLQFIVSRGKWIGGGDIRLGLLMGLALGWPDVILAIFLAYFIGSIVGVGLIVSGKKQWGSKVPLGIFLSTATVIVLFWGEIILEWYGNLFLFGL